MGACRDAVIFSVVGVISALYNVGRERVHSSVGLCTEDSFKGFVEFPRQPFFLMKVSSGRKAEHVQRRRRRISIGKLTRHCLEYKSLI